MFAFDREKKIVDLKIENFSFVNFTLNECEMCQCRNMKMCVCVEFTAANDLKL